jgi:DNA-binding GntR family transcriptional regulator
MSCHGRVLHAQIIDASTTTAIIGINRPQWRRDRGHLMTSNPPFNEYSQFDAEDHAEIVTGVSILSMIQM